MNTKLDALIQAASIQAKGSTEALVAWLRTCYLTGFVHGEQLVLSLPGADNVARSCTLITGAVETGLIRSTGAAPARQQQFMGVGGEWGKAAGKYSVAHGYTPERSVLWGVLQAMYPDPPAPESSIRYSVGDGEPEYRTAEEAKAAAHFTSAHGNGDVGVYGHDGAPDARTRFWKEGHYDQFGRWIE